MTTGPKEWSPWYSRWPHDIFDAAARMLFVSAWADHEEAEGRSYAGENLMDVAPVTSDDARAAAADLFKSTETLNHKPIEDLYRQALRRSGRKDLKDIVRFRETFAHDLVLQALGHGVGLGDDFENHGVKVPSLEFHL